MYKPEGFCQEKNPCLPNLPTFLFAHEHLLTVGLVQSYDVYNFILTKALKKKLLVSGQNKIEK